MLILMIGQRLPGANGAKATIALRVESSAMDARHTICRPAQRPIDF